MNITLKLSLIFISFLSIITVIRISQKSKMELKDAINWFLLSILFLFMAIFPQSVTLFARIIGVVDAPNAVFMIVIFLLLVVVFYLNIRISRLSLQVKDLVQKLGANQYKSSDCK